MKRGKTRVIIVEAISDATIRIMGLLPRVTNIFHPLPIISELDCPFHLSSIVLVAVVITHGHPLVDRIDIGL